MKILHTSDWHLGATLAGHERLAEQARFLQWLLDTASAQGIDALLVAGDVYDTVNPPIEAQRLLAWFLVEMRRLLPSAHVVVTAGNHDSAARLEAPHPFTQALGNLYLVGAAEVHGNNCLLPLPGSDGAPGAWCLAVPFLRPADLECKVAQGESPEQAFVRSVREFHALLRERARAQDSKLPLVVMGHCTLGGAERAGSERLLIGGVESLPWDALAEGADYVALGHIHRAQRVGSDVVRYSGCPYALDCDERRYTHQVLLVTLESAGAPVHVESLAVPEVVPLLRFPAQPGGWEQLEAEVRAYPWESWRGVARDLQPLVELLPQGVGPAAQLRERVEALCAGLPLRLVRAHWQNVAEGGLAAETALVDLSARQAPEEIFTRYYAGRHAGSTPDANLLACFRAAVDAVAVEGA